MNKRLYMWIIKIGFSALLLYLVWQLIDPQIFVEYLGEAKWYVLLLLLLLIPVTIGLRAWRFQYLINHEKKLMGFFDSFKLALVGETLNIALPASSGDLAKAYYGYKEHNIKEEMLSVTILDKVAGLLGLFILGVVASVIHGFLPLAAAFGAGALIIGGFMFFPRFIPWSWGKWLQRKIRRQLVDVELVKKSFSQTPRVKIIGLVLAVIGWISSYIQLWVVALLFGISVNLIFLFTVAPLINLSRLFPLSWSGLGVQEGVTIYLFSLAAIPATAAVVVSLGFTVSATILPGIIGLYFVIKMKSQ